MMVVVLVVLVVMVIVVVGWRRRRRRWRKRQHAERSLLIPSGRTQTHGHLAVTWPRWNQYQQHSPDTSRDVTRRITSQIHAVAGVGRIPKNFGPLAAAASGFSVHNVRYTHHTSSTFCVPRLIKRWLELWFEFDSTAVRPSYDHSTTIIGLRKTDKFIFIFRTIVKWKSS